jgi:hypothetical protein
MNRLAALMDASVDIQLVHRAKTAGHCRSFARPFRPFIRVNAKGIGRIGVELDIPAPTGSEGAGLFVENIEHRTSNIER